MSNRDYWAMIFGCAVLLADVAFEKWLQCYRIDRELARRKRRSLLKPIEEWPADIVGPGEACPDRPHMHRIFEARIDEAGRLVDGPATSETLD
jgi:hypothetical protein